MIGLPPNRNFSDSFREALKSIGAKGRLNAADIDRLVWHMTKHQWVESYLPSQKTNFINFLL